MLEHWIKPLEDSDLTGFFVPSEALGHHIDFNADNIGRNCIALIGVDPKWSRRVRRQLYQFAARNKQGMVCDLGDFRKVHPEFVIPAIQEVLAAGICPVVIGARPDLSLTVLHAIRSAGGTAGAVFFHEQIPTWLTAVPGGGPMQVVGVQQHLMHMHRIAQAENDQVGYVRLGAARSDLVSVEPLVRDAALMSVDMSAIRYSDLPAQASHSTSGFTTEETCQMMRYAGMSPGMKAVVLTGHDPRSVMHGQSVNTVAQMIWYFIDGFEQRIEETPGDSGQFTRYMVHLKEHDFDLSFHKSEKSGRWWVEVAGKEGVRVFSCAYRDYQAACEDVVTERILSCIGVS